MVCRTRLCPYLYMYSWKFRLWVPYNAPFFYSGVENDNARHFTQYEYSKNSHVVRNQEKHWKKMQLRVYIILIYFVQPPTCIFSLIQKNLNLSITAFFFKSVKSSIWNPSALMMHLLKRSTPFFVLQLGLWSHQTVNFGRAEDTFVLMLPSASGIQDVLGN